MSTSQQVQTGPWDVKEDIVSYQLAPSNVWVYFQRIPEIELWSGTHALSHQRNENRPGRTILNLHEQNEVTLCSKIVLEEQTPEFQKWYEDTMDAKERLDDNIYFKQLFAGPRNMLS